MTEESSFYDILNLTLTCTVYLCMIQKFHFTLSLHIGGLTFCTQRIVDVFTALRFKDEEREI